MTARRAVAYLFLLSVLLCPGMADAQPPDFHYLHGLSFDGLPEGSGHPGFYTAAIPILDANPIRDDRAYSFCYSYRREPNTRRGSVRTTVRVLHADGEETSTRLSRRRLNRDEFGDCVELSLDLEEGDVILWEHNFKRARPLESTDRVEMFWAIVDSDNQVDATVEANFEVQLVAVKLKCFVLIQHVDRGVAHVRNHADSPGRELQLF